MKVGKSLWVGALWQAALPVSKDEQKVLSTEASVAVAVESTTHQEQPCAL